MTIGETVRKALKELSESILNSITLDFKLDNGAVTKPKRARTKKGTYKADDKSTPNVNEAWVGGKAPKKKAKRKTKRKK
jgi:hypothetical protein